MNIAGSNHGASSAYTEFGPPDMMIALQTRDDLINSNALLTLKPLYLNSDTDLYHS